MSRTEAIRHFERIEKIVVVAVSMLVAILSRFVGCLKFQVQQDGD